MAKKAGKKPAEEWLCGRYPAPFTVEDEGEPYRPEIILVAHHGDTLGSLLVHPSDPPEAALEVLTQTFEEPYDGRPRRPAKLRVVGEALAKALAPLAAEGVEITAGPAPALDKLAGEVLEDIAAERELEEAARLRSFLGLGVAPEVAAGLFEAAAKLYRAAPWGEIIETGYPTGFDCPALGKQRACLVLFGQESEEEPGAIGEAGFSLFNSADDYAEVTTYQLNEDEDAPEPEVDFFALQFEPKSALTRELVQEIEAKGWTIAGEQAYPDLSAISSDGSRRPITAKEVSIAWACCEALLKLVEGHAAQLSAPSGERVTLELRPVKMPGSPAITLTAPHPDLELSGEAEELFGQFQDELEQIFEQAREQADKTKKPRD